MHIHDDPARRRFEQTWAQRALLPKRRRHAQDQSPGYALIARRPTGAQGVLSNAHQRVWLLEQLDPGTAAYHSADALRLDGLLDLVALRRSVDEQVLCREILRMTSDVREEPLVQVIKPELRIPLSIVDLRALPALEKQHEVDRRLDTEEVRRLRWIVLRPG